jgi:hypothetical protein
LTRQLTLPRQLPTDLKQPEVRYESTS